MEWETINWEAISALGTCASVIFTLVLTAIIIYQTRNLNDKQQDLEKRINELQLELQKRQIKVDIFPFKREIYLNALRVLEFTNYLSSLINKIDLYKKSYVQLFSIYDTLREQSLGDIQIILNSLQESKYILPKEVSDSIIRIRNDFDNLCMQFTQFNTIHKILTKEELESIKHKETSIKEIIKACNSINSKANFVLFSMERELNIANLDK